MFAYLFERFPAYTQTFCYREVLEMERQNGTPFPIFSIRPCEGTPDEFPKGLLKKVTYLPEAAVVREEVKQLRKKRKLPPPIARELDRDDRRDLLRVMEAALLGPLLQAAGVSHVHVHFAGIASRTAYWLRRFYGISYSITCHANDIFCKNDFALTPEEIFRNAAFLVTVADFTKEWLLERHPGLAGKVHRVYNGIEPVDAGNAAAPGSATPHLLSVGRCIPKKGFADLIEACRLLRERGIDFRCTIVGEGPLRAELQEKVVALGLESVVAMPGPAPQARVQELLSQATLFVLACAVEPEGGMDCLPTVIAEAMMWGLPVVSTRLAAVPEMVLDRQTGLLVEPHCPAELAGAIEEMLGNPALAASYGVAGRAHAEREFSVVNTVAQLSRLLKEVK